MNGLTDSHDEYNDGKMTISSNRFHHERPFHMQPFNGPSVWYEFTTLAKLTKSINLGQGSPGWGSPDFIKDALVETIQSNEYAQYATTAGAPQLTEEIKRIYYPRLIPKSMNEKEAYKELDVLVTNGASHAISLAVMSILNPEDEVILIEPTFDMYTGIVKITGAKPIYTTLKPKEELNQYDIFSSSRDITSQDFELDYEDFEKKITENTKMLILNTPHNPLGKVFSKQELEKISNILHKKSSKCIIVSDEVYEYLTYDDQFKHVSISSINKESNLRTLTIFSSGKTFSSTGLKVGWIIGNKSLIGDLRIFQQYNCFSVNHISQIAIAKSLRIAKQTDYHNQLKSNYLKKRNILIKVIKDAGFIPIIPDGAFFVCAHIPKDHPVRLLNDTNDNTLPSQVENFVNNGVLSIEKKSINRYDYNVSRNLILNYRVASIPLSVFFSDEHINTSQLSKCVLRFAFCHPDEDLKRAGKYLRNPIDEKNLEK